MILRLGRWPGSISCISIESRERNVKRNILRISPAKTALLALFALAFALVAPKTAQAAKILGGISFNGNVTPYLNTIGTGPTATDLISAKSWVFGPTVTSLGANGSFGSVPSGVPVTMYSPLDVNPPALTIPASTPVWQVTSGGITYAFVLSSLTEPVDAPTYLVLTGAGTVSDGTPADNNTGNWVATFTTEGSTYSWNASFQATPLPEPASLSVIGIAGIGLLRRRRVVRV
jgi:hypothetical protein